jgi:hypothetical protein
MAREALKAQKRLGKAVPKLKDVGASRRQSFVVAQVGGVCIKTRNVTSRGRTIIRPTKLST